MQVFLDNKNWFIRILFLVLVVYLFSKYLGGFGLELNSVTTSKNDAFTVSADGSAPIMVKSATLSFILNSNGSDLKAVDDNLSQMLTKVTKAIADQGIAQSDISADKANIVPTTDLSQAMPGIKVASDSAKTNYQGNISFKVTIKDMSKSDKIIQTASSNGAIVAGSAQVDQADKDAATDNARKQAVDKVKQKANRIASSAGLSLGRVINYKETVTDNSGVPAGVGTNANQVSISVTIGYEIR